MPKKIMDPSGAILFYSTPEELEAQKLQEKVKELEKRIEVLENLLRKEKNNG